jgi:sporulation related protein
MSGPRRVRGAVLMVLIASAALLGLARWAGRFAARGAGERAGARGADPTLATTAAGADLSFYRALGGGGTAPGGRGTGPSSDGRSIRPAPGDLVAPGGAYVVQVMATRDEAQAERTRDRLARHGYPAAVAIDEMPGGAIYRVRVGRWKERGPAEAMAKTLREKERLEPWVLQEAGP